MESPSDEVLSASVTKANNICGSPNAMKLDYAPPPAGLADCISAFYLFEADVAEMTDIERADIAQLRFVLDGSGTVHFADGREEPLLPASLCGPRSAASIVTGKGPRLRMFGCGLPPIGWARLTGQSAAEFANKIVPASDHLPFDVTAMRDRLRGCSSLAEMIEASQELIGAMTQALDDKQLWLVRAIDHWLESALAPSIADLETATGLSRRQIERRCLQYYGAPPKVLARKYRALRSANAISNGTGDWRQFIDEAYYDQPHFIREIREFIGMTPSAIRDHRSPLSVLAFGRSQLAGAVRPLVSET
jgi:AraC-like DNA-binding protein